MLYPSAKECSHKTNKQQARRACLCAMHHPDTAVHTGCSNNEQHRTVHTNSCKCVMTHPSNEQLCIPANCSQVTKLTSDKAEMVPGPTCNFLLSKQRHTTTPYAVHHSPLATVQAANSSGAPPCLFMQYSIVPSHIRQKTSAAGANTTSSTGTLPCTQAHKTISKASRVSAKHTGSSCQLSTIPAKKTKKKKTGSAQNWQRSNCAATQPETKQLRQPARRQCI